MTGSHLAPLRFDSNAPVHHLNQVINWYRHARTGVPIYAGYSKEIERQHADIERRVDILIATPRPEARLQFADGGLELLVRYPVEIRKALPMRTSKPPSQARRNSVGYQGLATHTIAWRAGAPATSPPLKSRVTNITAKRN